MYNVRITFRGLCAFIPGDATPSPAWVGVFLVDADEQSRANRQIERPAHYPFVRFNISDVHGLVSPPNAFGFWRLGDEDVVIKTGSASGARVNIVRKTNGPTGQVPYPEGDPVEESYFDWVSDIDRVHPGAGNVHGECFEPNPGGRVSVRVHLREGNLKTETLGKFEAKYVLSQFDPPRSGAGPRALARRVVLEIPNISSPLELRARRFGDDRHRKLVFKDPGEGETLNLEILNICLDDLIQDPNRPREHPRPDRDFLWYYVLSQDFGAAPINRGLPVPVPVSFFISSGVGGGEPAQCTETGFKPPAPTSATAMRTLADSILSAVD